MENYNDFATATNENMEKMNSEFDLKTSILHSDSAYSGESPTQSPNSDDKTIKPALPIIKGSGGNKLLNSLLIYLILSLLFYNNCG